MRGRSPRANGRQLVAARLDGLLHPVLGVVEELVGEIGHRMGSPACAATVRSSRPFDETIVPTRSPETTRSMLCSSARLKTQIGRSLSMHSDSAVESMTRR